MIGSSKRATVVLVEHYRNEEHQRLQEVRRDIRERSRHVGEGKCKSIKRWEIDSKKLQGGITKEEVTGCVAKLENRKKAGGIARRKSV